MLLSRRLPKLFRSIDGIGLTIAGVGLTPSRADIFAVERAVIQIQVEWEQFVRGIILDSATGRFSNSKGPILSKSHNDIKTREIAAHKLISLYPKRSIEPDWYLPRDAIDAAIRLDISNAADISAELGLTPWPIDELRYIRNFIAHKSKRSALCLRSTKLIGRSNRIHVFDAVTAYGPSGNRNYENWLHFIRGAAIRVAT